MPDQLQLRGGTTAQHASFTGVSKEVTIDTTKKTAVVHDGTTAGGNPLLREDASNSALALGSAGTPSLKFTGDTNTGIYSPGADQVAISTGGSGRLFVNSSGQIGVGVSPTDLLHIQATNDARLRIKASGSGAGTNSTINLETASEGHWVIQSGNATSSGLRFFDVNASSERMRLDSSGRLGVGTSAPDGTTHIHTASAGTVTANSTADDLVVENSGAGGISILTPDGSNGAIFFGSPSDAIGAAARWNYNLGEFYIGSDKAGAVTKLTSGDGTTAVTIDSSQRVGIGTSAPSSLLHLQTTSANVVMQMLENNGSTVYGASIDAFNSSGGNIRVRLHDSGGTYQERLRITSAGNVGIGVTSPTQKFQVTDGTLSNFFVAPGYNSGQGTTLAVGGGEYIEFATNGITNPRARIDSSGRLLVGTSTTYGSSANLQVVGTPSAAASIDINRFTNGTGSGSLYFYKSRGASVGTNTIVNSDDELGALYFMGANGTSYNLAASIIANVDGTPGASNDMPGRLVFSTTADGAASPTEQLRITNDGVRGYNQAAPVAVDTTATLTVANLKNGIITSTTAAAVTGTLPTGTLTEGGFSGLYTNFTFEWTVINTGATNSFTVAAGTAHTVVGNMVVAAGNSGRFATRRTAANTFVTYRLSS